jgi:hypothetical protein
LFLQITISILFGGAAGSENLLIRVGFSAGAAEKHSLTCLLPGMQCCKIHLHIVNGIFKEVFGNLQLSRVWSIIIK